MFLLKISGEMTAHLLVFVSGMKHNRAGNEGKFVWHDRQYFGKHFTQLGFRFHLRRRKSRTEQEILLESIVAALRTPRLGIIFARQTFFHFDHLVGFFLLWHSSWLYQNACRFEAEYVMLSCQELKISYNRNLSKQNLANRILKIWAVNGKRPSPSEPSSELRSRSTCRHRGRT